MEEELTSRQPPQSLEAEQAVLGSILIDSRCVADVIGILRPEDFFLKQNQELYEAVYTMFNFSQTIDPVTVLDKLRELGYYHDNSRDYVLQLMEITPTAANAVRYAHIVRDKSMLRGLAQAADEISETVYSQVGTPEEMLESAEKKIYALRKGERGDSLEHIGTILHKVFDRLTELSQSDSAIPGLSTGMQDLDSKINGLNKSDLIILAARPAMGKSAFALNIALNVAKKYNKTVAFFSLEMSREQLAMRLMSSESFVNSQKLATGKLTEEEWGKLAMASSALSQTDIRIDDNPSVTVAEMNAKCRRLDNLGLVVIDYLQLMTASGYGKGSGENRVTVVGEISRALKIMAKELNVPVICLSQLSRAVESRTDKRPIPSDLRESGTIEQDADSVLFLYRDEYYNENTEEKNVAECIVAKNRHGETGTVKLQWLGQYGTFADREWKHAE
ncbi:MAG TPA: replicative DNA helicase [Candidatus Faecousia intestinigallinarum]|nr:replicative DNA helicase [Candidatus Faecousia intestinigallinarum]